MSKRTTTSSTSDTHWLDGVNAARERMRARVFGAPPTGFGDGVPLSPHTANSRDESEIPENSKMRKLSFSDSEKVRISLIRALGKADESCYLNDISEFDEFVTIDGRFDANILCRELIVWINALLDSKNA